MRLLDAIVHFYLYLYKNTILIMAKKRQFGARNVVVGDIIRRHPAGMRFETDLDYTDLANKIYNIIRNLAMTSHRNSVFTQTYIIF